MIITGVESDYIRETGNYTRAGGTYQRTFRASFTEGYSVAAFIHNTDGGLPKYGDIHAEDTASTVTKVTPQMESDSDDQQAGYALYIVDYSPYTADFAANPLSRPPDIEWGGEAISEIMYFDLSSSPKPVLNSSSDRYDPMPEREILGPCCTITRNEASNPATIMETYSLSTSSDGLSGATAADIPRLGIITGRLIYENGIAYWQVRYPIYFKRDGWALKVIDNGHRKILDDGTTRRRITDDMGQTTPVPCLLDGSGGELDASADPVVFPTAGYKKYPSLSWSSLGLPNVFA